MYINSNEPFYGAVNSNHIVCIYTECSVKQLRINDGAIIYKGYRVIAETVKNEVTLGIYTAFDKAETIRKMLVSYLSGDNSGYVAACNLLGIKPIKDDKVLTVPKSDVIQKEGVKCKDF